VILDGLGTMMSGDGFNSFKVSNGAGDLQDADDSAGGKAKFVNGLLQ